LSRLEEKSINKEYSVTEMLLKYIKVSLRDTCLRKIFNKKRPEPDMPNRQYRRRGQEGKEEGAKRGYVEHRPIRTHRTCYAPYEALKEVMQNKREPGVA